MTSATSNSGARGRGFGASRGRKWRFEAVIYLMLGVGGTGASPAASPSRAEITNRVQQAHQAAEAEFNSQPTNTEAAWHLARACFDLADLATKSSERARLAQQGIKAAQLAINLDSNLAAAHYYLAMDMGQLARTRTLGALGLVGQMEREFKRAIQLDEKFDYAGAERSLAMLYRDAPSLTSVGSKSKAQEHFRRAVEIAPEFPENRLAFLESCLKWGQRDEARKQLQALESLWPAAKQRLSGPDWASSWEEWEQRLNQARKRLE